MRKLCVALCGLMFSVTAWCQNDFNAYIVRAVAHLAENRSGLGYASAAYTENLQFGSLGILKATRPPFTMCVAAQVEIIKIALDFYVADSNDRAVYRFLPFKQWTALRPGSLRGKIWMVDDSGSRGTAHALQTFGMGAEVSFENLTPGSFVNLNRERTGHAVVFLAYLNGIGQELTQYDETVKGFKYFSSQGNETTGGFGYRYAFFQDAGCPILDSSRRRDCGVIRSKNQRMLNSGVMLHPKKWDVKRRDQALVFSKAVQKGPELPFDATYFDGKTTDDE